MTNEMENNISIKPSEKSEKALKMLEETVSTGNLYGYARVSTEKQELAPQVKVLKEFGVSEKNIFKEKGSGSKMTTRKELNKMLEKLERGDTLVVHKLDRLGRSVSQVTSLIDDLSQKGIFLVVIDTNIDTRKVQDGISGVSTKVMITVLGLMAELERLFIEERTKPALEAARKKGVKFGRKTKNKEMYDMAIKMYLDANGEKSVKEVLESFGKDEKGKDTLIEPTFFKNLRIYKEELESNENA